MQTITECFGAQCHGKDQDPVYEKIHLKEVGDDDVLVKIDAAGISHFEKYLIQGGIVHMHLYYPFVPGLEGVGHVVKTGKNAGNLQGKRVMVAPGIGSWAEYVVISTRMPIGLVVIDQSVPKEKAAFGIGNPATALGLLDDAEKRGSKSVVFDAAASALGRIFNRIAKGKLQIINIVRTQEQKDILTQEGAERVIITEGNWEEEYKKQTAELSCNLLIDSLGSGPMLEQLLRGLAPGGYAFVIGFLSGKTIVNIGTQEKVQVQKCTVQGWSSSVWLKSLNEEEIKKFSEMISKGVTNELTSTVQKQFALKDITKAYQAQRSNNTKGKLLLIP